MERHRPPADDLIRRLASCGLRGIAGSLGIRTAPTEWSFFERERITRRAQGEGIWPLILTAPEAAPLLHAAPTPAIETQRARTLSALADARSIAEHLSRARIPCRFIYGTALVRLYSDPGLRPLQDIDLWVTPRRREEAHAILTGMGFVQAAHGDIILRRSVPTPSNVDLLAEVPPLADPLVEERGRALPSWGIPILPPEAELTALLWRTLLHKGRLRWMWLSDLALLLHQEGDRLNWDDFHARVHRARLELPAAYAASCLAPLVGRADAGRLVGPGPRRRPRFWEGRIAALWDRGGFRGAGHFVEAYWKGGSPSARAVRILRLLWPDAQFLARRYGLSPASRSSLAARRILRPLALAKQLIRSLPRWFRDPRPAASLTFHAEPPRIP